MRLVLFAILVMAAAQVGQAQNTVLPEIDGKGDEAVAIQLAQLAARVTVLEARMGIQSPDVAEVPQTLNIELVELKDFEAAPAPRKTIPNLQTIAQQSTTVTPQPMPQAPPAMAGCPCGCPNCNCARATVNVMPAPVVPAPTISVQQFGGGSSGSYGAYGGGSTGTVRYQAGGGSTGSYGSYGSSGSMAVNYSAAPVVRSAPRIAPVRNLLSAIPRRAGHWSYPGSINGHLNSGHAGELQRLGINTAGMSQQQMLDLHDALHEGTLGASPVMMAPRRTVYASNSLAGYGSNCPGGVCPTGGYNQRRGLFGFRRR